VFEWVKGVRRDEERHDKVGGPRWLVVRTPMRGGVYVKGGEKKNGGALNLMLAGLLFVPAGKGDLSSNLVSVGERSTMWSPWRVFVLDKKPWAPSAVRRG